MGNCESSGASQSAQTTPPKPPTRRVLSEDLFTDSKLWKDGNPLVITANGRGKLVLLAIPDSNLNCSCRRKVIASTWTDFPKTEFFISFSYYYERFIFYWEAATVDEQPAGLASQKAWCGSKKTENRLELGTSWMNATEVNRTGVFSRVCLEPEYYENAERAENATVYISRPDMQTDDASWPKKTKPSVQPAYPAVDPYIYAHYLHNHPPSRHQ